MVAEKQFGIVILTSVQNFTILFRIAVIKKAHLFISSNCQIAKGLEQS